MLFQFGLDYGAAFLGVLFHAIGTRNTLILYAGMTAIMLALLISYIKFSTHVNEYEKLPVDSDYDLDDNSKHSSNDE